MRKPDNTDMRDFLTTDCWFVQKFGYKPEALSTLAV